MKLAKTINYILRTDKNNYLLSAETMKEAKMEACNFELSANEKIIKIERVERLTKEALAMISESANDKSTFLYHCDSILKHVYKYGMNVCTTKELNNIFEMIVLKTVKTELANAYSEYLKRRYNEFIRTLSSLRNIQASKEARLRYNVFYGYGRELKIERLKTSEYQKEKRKSASNIKCLLGESICNLYDSVNDLWVWLYTEVLPERKLFSDICETDRVVTKVLKAFSDDNVIVASTESTFLSEAYKLVDAELKRAETYSNNHIDIELYSEELQHNLIYRMKSNTILASASAENYVIREVDYSEIEHIFKEANLTPKQIDVLFRVANDESLREIARATKRNLSTTRESIASAKKKLAKLYNIPFDSSVNSKKFERKKEVFSTDFDYVKEINSDIHAKTEAKKEALKKHNNVNAENYYNALMRKSIFK